jgi:hypothetical protein
MDEMQRALDNLKILISKPPALASPEPSETLLLYVVTTTQVISAALVVEWEEPRHIYKVHQRSTTSTKYSPSNPSGCVHAGPEEDIPGPP